MASIGPISIDIPPVEPSYNVLDSMSDIIRDHLMPKFVGQKICAPMLYSIRSQVLSILHHKMCIGNIDSIPQIYVARSSENASEILIHTPRYEYDAHNGIFLGCYEDYDLYINEDTQQFIRIGSGTAEMIHMWDTCQWASVARDRRTHLDPKY